MGTKASGSLSINIYFKKNKRRKKNIENNSKPVQTSNDVGLQLNKTKTGLASTSLTVMKFQLTAPVSSRRDEIRPLSKLGKIKQACLSRTTYSKGKVTNGSCFI